jgi:hypothetical protein
MASSTPQIKEEYIETSLSSRSQSLKSIKRPSLDYEKLKYKIKQELGELAHLTASRPVVPRPEYQEPIGLEIHRRRIMMPVHSPTPPHDDHDFVHNERFEQIFGKRRVAENKVRTQRKNVLASPFQSPKRSNLFQNDGARLLGVHSQIEERVRGISFTVKS